MTIAGIAACMLMPAVFLPTGSTTGPTGDASHVYAPTDGTSLAPVKPDADAPFFFVAFPPPFVPLAAMTADTPPRHDHPGTATPMSFGTGQSARPNPEAYNCFSFAWHRGRGDPTDESSHDSRNPLWDHDAENDMADSRPLQHGERAQIGDVVAYGVDGYSGPVDGRLQGSEVVHATVVIAVNDEGEVLRVAGKEGGTELTDHHPADPNPVYWHLPESGTDRRDAFLTLVVRPIETDEARRQRVAYVSDAVGDAAFARAEAVG